MKMSEATRKVFQEVGRLGGHARAKKMSEPQRIAAARRAATIRWANERAKKAKATA